MNPWNDVAGAFDDVAGAFDDAAGSVDESINRQFDDQPGGGFADEIANQSWDHVSGSADWWLGDVDETIGNQFDDEPGGGPFDFGAIYQGPDPFFLGGDGAGSSSGSGLDLLRVGAILLAVTGIVAALVDEFGGGSS